MLARCGAPATPSARSAAPIDPTAEPAQQTIELPASRPIEVGGERWQLTPRARYRVAAIVVAKARYRWGRSARLAPYDLALVWGELAQLGLHRQIRWSQGDRNYRWIHDLDFPHENADAFIAAHSANTHLIVESDNLRRALDEVTVGEAVELAGDLVSVRLADTGGDWRWESSLSRRDRGDGSCELLALRELRKNEFVYH